MNALREAVREYLDMRHVWGFNLREGASMAARWRRMPNNRSNAT
jgi:hypothetical protein